MHGVLSAEEGRRLGELEGRTGRSGLRELEEPEELDWKNWKNWKGGMERRGKLNLRKK